MIDATQSLLAAMGPIQLHMFIDEGRRTVCDPAPRDMMVGTHRRPIFDGAPNRCAECERGLKSMETWRRST